MAKQLERASAFDGAALIRALDDQRQARGLTWTRLAEELWAQSAALNARLGGNAMCPGALYRTSIRQTMTGHYALSLLRWLGRPPEDFLDGPSSVAGVGLPPATTEQRLRWQLARLYETVDAQRRAENLTWTALASQVGCTPSRLTNLRTARLADMGLTMQLTQRLGLPAARFIDATDW